jgi:hypothetical protein
MALLLALVAAPASAKDEAWRHDTASAFEAGKADGVVISDSGAVRLGRSVDAVGKLDAARVWDLARARDGSTYAATGDAGKVLQRKGDGPWAEAYDAEDTQALCLVATPDGKVFVGTGPSGQVVDVTDPKHPGDRPGPDVRYVWDLAAGPDGSIYAATGPAGELWKRPPGGAWTRLLDSKQKHLLSVVVAPDGSVFAGSDGEGLIYRVDRDAKVSVVYDASQPEIRTLAIGPDGALYAGTASGTGEGAGGGSPRPPGGGAMREDQGPRIIRTASTRRLVQDSPGGTSRPKPASTGENAVYRVGADGSVREIFRAKALVFALAWQGETLLVGTGPEGRLYEVRGLGRESAVAARVDHGQILALSPSESGDVLMAVGDPGGVLELGARHARSGSLTSDVLDARLVAKFGAIGWRGDTPQGTSIAVQVRSGNVGTPDETWSDWSRPQADSPAKADVPPARFAQYRVTLATDDAGRSPELRAVTLYYRTLNLPPEIARITIPDLTAADGTARRTKLDLKWDASDPNDDDLAYSLAIRKEGWPDWVPLGGPEPLREKAFSWDTTSVPAGIYRVRVEANDRPSNRADEALTASLASEPFVVDHQAPTVSVAADDDGLGAKVRLGDDLTRLVSAEYAVDGGAWSPAFPEDGLFDSRAESIAIRLPDLKPGSHVLMIRGTDAAGNVGAGDVVLRIR